jgi:hypothetical protein
MQDILHEDTNVTCGMAWMVTPFGGKLLLAAFKWTYTILFDADVGQDKPIVRMEYCGRCECTHY